MCCHSPSSPLPSRAGSLPHMLPNLPFWKSTMALRIWSGVFMTKGPRAAMGSSMGSPASSSTLVSFCLALRTTLEPPRLVMATSCGPRSLPCTTRPPLRTKMMTLFPSTVSSTNSFFVLLMRMSHMSTCVHVLAGPVTLLKEPAMTRTRPSSSGEGTVLSGAEGSASRSGATGISSLRRPWYRGLVILCLAGRFTHSWHISNVPPCLANSVEWNSS
mmetsp:Transcript_13072/g.36774  ORF Transcript_13072/g.36774 Transcript_13072/m.36774 type:complete len:216 (+) Transcript_13072:134-781(+)